MADTTVRYEPRNYRRVCDICGMLRNISDMHKQDELWVCTYDAGERVRTELDRGNANQRPFTIKPVPYPKPQNNYYPNLLETDDAAVFNFLAQQVAARCRYEYVQSGSAPATSLGGVLPTMGWAARYFYDLIQENDPSRQLLIPKAKELLVTIAAFVLTRQRGTPGGFSPSSRASDCFYGGFLASGATTYVTQDTSTCGLALLYAYRVLGTASYINGARAAASYLRNVQAIGSNGVNFTSTNSAGTGRLYTGAVCSEVSTTFGIDPGQIFYSNHLFYPSDLLALEFWNELKLTDGDQSIGATAAVNGFSTTPAQLLSQSIADMRSCWETGITDSTGTLINGLSSSTPREYFNAYPATKTGFTVAGTGLWEFSDGNASTGTQITSQNFANAISALYNYEGATSQVTGLSDWLRSFTSNPDFETPDNTSVFELYEGTTGTYDPTLAPATLLQVRDPDTFAATAINGSSLYDWGAFGLLSRLWASRNKGSFMQSRLYPLNTVQRFFAGNSTDVATDRIPLRGMSGLTLQTGFRIDTNGNGAVAYSGQDGTAITPTTDGLSFWIKGDKGVTTDSFGILTKWADQSGTGQDLDTIEAPGDGPTWGTDTLNGIPGANYGTATGLSLNLTRTTNLKDSDGNTFGVSPGETDKRTIYAVFRPRIGGPGNPILGGYVFSFRAGFAFQCMFYIGQFDNNFMIYDSFGSFSGFQAEAPRNGATRATYNGVPIMADWRSDYSAPHPNLAFSFNGVEQLPLTGVNPVISSADQGPGSAGVFLGVEHAGALGNNWHGSIFEVLVYKGVHRGQTLATNRAYLSTKYNLGAVNLAMVNDAVRAAQLGRMFREARN